MLAQADQKKKNDASPVFCLYWDGAGERAGGSNLSHPEASAPAVHCLHGNTFPPATATTLLCLPVCPLSPADEAAAFTDGTTAWFNAARDLLPPAPPAAGADAHERTEHELQMHGHEAARRRHWLHYTCDLVAQCFFDDAYAEVQAHFCGVEAAV